MNQIVIEDKELSHTYAVYLKGLKSEIKFIEERIRAIKVELHKPHTQRTSDLQQNLVLEYKPRATFLYTLRTALRGKVRDNGFYHTNVDDTRSLKAKQDEYLLRCINGYLGKNAQHPFLLATKE